MEKDTKRRLNIGILVSVLLVAGMVFFFNGEDDVTGNLILEEGFPFSLTDEENCPVEDILPYGDYRFCRNEIEEGFIVYLLEIISENDVDGGMSRYLYNFRNLPGKLNKYDVEDGISEFLLASENGSYKEKIYITVPPTFTSAEVLSAATLVQALGAAEQGVFKIPIEVVFSEENELGVPVRTCDDANKSVGVISMQKGQESKSFFDGDCVVIQGEGFEDLLGVTEKITYQLFNVIQ